MPILNAAMQEFEITSRKRACAFLAQCGHESLDFTVWTENLNYSADRLGEVFEKYFPTVELASSYARKPQAIASRVYAGRMGNGDERSGDGWKYRGRGPIQATGREMYGWLENELNLPLLEKPELLLDPQHGMRAAAVIFAVKKDCNALCDRLSGTGEGLDLAQFDRISRRINGGNNGQADRRERYKRALKFIPNLQPAATVSSLGSSDLTVITKQQNLDATSEDHKPKTEDQPLFDVIPNNEDTRSLAKSGLKSAGRHLLRPITVLTTAVAAGEIWAWATAIVLIVGLAWIIFYYRRELKRGAIRILDKSKSNV